MTLNLHVKWISECLNDFLKQYTSMWYTYKHDHINFLSCSPLTVATTSWGSDSSRSPGSNSRTPRGP